QKLSELVPPEGTHFAAFEKPVVVCKPARSRRQALGADRKRTWSPRPDPRQCVHTLPAQPHESERLTGSVAWSWDYFDLRKTSYFPAQGGVIRSRPFDRLLVDHYFLVKIAQGGICQFPVLSIFVPLIRQKSEKHPHSDQD